MTSFRIIGLLFFLHFLQLPPQPAKSPHQARTISPMNHPRGKVSGEKKLDRVHRELRPRGRLALAATPAPASDSIACASSISRCSNSSRNRDQQTRNAKQENASQLIRRTWPMRGSSDPPPPITGDGCCVRKYQIDKKTSGTSSAPNTASAAASICVCALLEKPRSTR